LTLRLAFTKQLTDNLRTPSISILLEKLIVAQLLKIFPPFFELEGALADSLKPLAGLHADPKE
jgi:hypothetical protein